MKSLPPAPADETTAHTNGNGHHQPKGTFNALLEEAQAIENTLRDALIRSNQLLGGLKAYRRHAKAMSSTLASLRQLQNVEA